MEEVTLNLLQPEVHVPEVKEIPAVVEAKEIKHPVLMLPQDHHNPPSLLLHLHEEQNHAQLQEQDNSIQSYRKGNLIQIAFLFKS